MRDRFRFAVASDLHVAVESTITANPRRFHLVEVSIPAFEDVLARLAGLDLDFLLLPGDLTQDGEPENHAWLRDRLASLPYPVYVIPGNHDILAPEPTDTAIAAREFPRYYRDCGYREGDRLYYTQEILPGVRLIALNSNEFAPDGKQLGRLDDEQMAWLRELLPTLSDRLILVAIHHNIVEHFPGQAQHPLSRRYMLDNAPELRQLLREYGVNLAFSGHLHVQDIARDGSLYDITTGSLVSYPHPYRVIDVQMPSEGEIEVQIRSDRVKSVPGWDDLQNTSREWLGQHSSAFLMRLLCNPPLSLSAETAEALLPQLRYFWADIAGGDAQFHFPQFPTELRRYFEQFGAIAPDGTPQLIDNCATLRV